MNASIWKPDDLVCEESESTRSPGLCSDCGVNLVTVSAHSIGVLSGQKWCLGCSPCTQQILREFVRCKADRILPGHVLAYRERPGLWRGIVIIDVKTKVAEIGGILAFRVRIFLATGQVLEVAPGDLVPLRPSSLRGNP